MRKALVILFISVLVSSVVFVIIIFLPLLKPSIPKTRVPYDRYLKYEKHDLLFLLLKKMGYMLVIRQFDYDKDLHRCIVLEENWNKNSFKKYSGWLGRGRRLIVFTGEIQDQGDDASTEDNLPPPSELKVKGGTASKLLEGVGSLSVLGSGWTTSAGTYVPGRETFSSHFEPLVTLGGDVILASSSYNGGEIIYIGNDTIFSDKLILEGDNAVLLNNLFKEYFHTRIAVDMTGLEDAASAGKTPEKPSYFFTKGIFPYIILQAGLIALAFFLANFKRFGGIVDYGKYKKRSIKNHLDAAGNFFANSGNTVVLVNVFDDYFFEKLSRLFPGINREELPAFLKERYGERAGSELFKKGRRSHIARIEEKRRDFIKIIEKGL
ncbi:MAG: hypothetical protein ABSG94_08215 [Brevinematales bacterium]|jgi:hypothetical protein